MDTTRESPGREEGTRKWNGSSIMWRTSLSSDSELSSSLPQLPLLVQFRLVHNLPSDLSTKNPVRDQRKVRRQQGDDNSN